MLILVPCPRVAKRTALFLKGLPRRTRRRRRACGRLPSSKRRKKRRFVMHRHCLRNFYKMPPSRLPATHFFS
ncbi:hypothetical protein TcasGA2_TC032009 [Tribolium castaneum]|uniref:Uncharacterized protein n=1 Tax=Tribolium castaneum TaxID=7070 RepID=A0A139WN54_TRICA|nr:hypothetical protein TcasGA2_TC032009 [Tribolium castaneum]